MDKLKIKKGEQKSLRDLEGWNEKSYVKVASGAVQPAILIRNSSDSLIYLSTGEVACEESFPLGAGEAISFNVVPHLVFLYSEFDTDINILITA